jgi:basic amino acid/polyamine antiporter, APA family
VLGIFFCVYLMLSLPAVTWIRFFVWMALGFAIYFGYGRYHSRIAQEDGAGRASASAD